MHLLGIFKSNTLRCSHLCSGWFNILLCLVMAIDDCIDNVKLMQHHGKRRRISLRSPPANLPDQYRPELPKTHVLKRKTHVLNPFRSFSCCNPYVLAAFQNERFPCRVFGQLRYRQTHMQVLAEGLSQSLLFAFLDQHSPFSSCSLIFFALAIASASGSFSLAVAS